MFKTGIPILSVVYCVLHLKNKTPSKILIPQPKPIWINLFFCYTVFCSVEFRFVAFTLWIHRNHQLYDWFNALIDLKTMLIIRWLFKHWPGNREVNTVHTATTKINNIRLFTLTKDEVMSFCINSHRSMRLLFISFTFRLLCVYFTCALLFWLFLFRIQ